MLSSGTGAVPVDGISINASALESCLHGAPSVEAICSHLGASDDAPDVSNCAFKPEFVKRGFVTAYLSPHI